MPARSTSGFGRPRDRSAISSGRFTITRRGYDLDPIAGEGYTSINAAFVLDQLAEIEQADGAPAAEGAGTKPGKSGGRSPTGCQSCSMVPHEGISPPAGGIS